MNEELQKAVTEMLNSALSAKDFLVGELPEYVEQLLVWKSVESFIFFIVAATVMMHTIRFIKRIKNIVESANHTYASDRDMHYVLLYLCAFIFGGGALIALCSNMDWLQIWIAPKVWLVEYAASLVK